MTIKYKLLTSGGEDFKAALRCQEDSNTDLWTVFLFICFPVFHHVSYADPSPGTLLDSYEKQLGLSLFEILV